MLWNGQCLAKSYEVLLTFLLNKLKILLKHYKPITCLLGNISLCKTVQKQRLLIINKLRIERNK